MKNGRKGTRKLCPMVYKILFFLWHLSSTTLITNSWMIPIAISIKHSSTLMSSDVLTASLIVASLHFTIGIGVMVNDHKNKENEMTRKARRSVIWIPVFIDFILSLRLLNLIVRLLNINYCFPTHLVLLSPSIMCISHTLRKSHRRIHFEIFNRKLGTCLIMLEIEWFIIKGI